MVSDHFWKNTFLTHSWSHNGPFSRHFGIFHGPKRVTTGSKRAKNTCLSMPSGLGTTSEKMIFSARGTLVDPPLGATVLGPGCPPAPRSDHWYGGPGVSLGDFEAWKPQKVGDCGCTRCPRNSVLSHVGQDTACSWFWACLTQTSHIQVIFFCHFWAVSRTYRGARGQERPLVRGQSRRTWSVGTVCLRLAVLTGFRGRLGPKKAVLGHKMPSFGRAPPYLAPPPRGATGEFLAENLDLARPPPRLYDG